MIITSTQVIFWSLTSKYSGSNNGAHRGPTNDGPSIRATKLRRLLTGDIGRCHSSEETVPTTTTARPFAKSVFQVVGTIVNSFVRLTGASPSWPAPISSRMASSPYVWMRYSFLVTLGGNQVDTVHACDDVRDVRMCTRPRLRPVVTVELPPNEHSPDLLRACTNGIQTSITKESPGWVL